MKMETLEQIEFDVIEISSGCAEACTHCSEAPGVSVRHGAVDKLIDTAVRVRQMGERDRLDPFGLYWFPFPASDPFSHPELFRLCDGIWKSCRVPVYLLSLGWNRETGARIARQFGENPESLFRIAITVSNFSLIAERNQARHQRRLADSLRDLEPLWRAKGPDGHPLILLSPQFIANEKAESPLSLESTRALLGTVANLAGIELGAWIKEGRIFERPVTGLGRAYSTLGVSRKDELAITAEAPFPEISKSPRRPFSGLITLDGGLAVFRAKRGILGRERHQWLPIHWDGSGTEMTIGNADGALANGGAGGRHNPNRPTAD